MPLLFLQECQYHEVEVLHTRQGKHRLGRWFLSAINGVFGRLPSKATQGVHLMLRHSCEATDVDLQDESAGCMYA
jgi:hypothetical protein